MSGQGRSILLVDDEDIVRLSCRRTLAPRGYEITEATDGLEALTLLRQRSFDIVITDLKMPNMDGIEFMDIIRRAAPGTGVLLVTGYATHEARAQAESMGARYLAKPFGPSELLKAIEGL